MGGCGRVIECRLIDLLQWWRFAWVQPIPKFSIMGSFSYGRVSLGGGDVSRLIVGFIGVGLGLLCLCVCSMFKSWVAQGYHLLGDGNGVSLGQV